MPNLLPPDRIDQIIAAFGTLPWTYGMVERSAILKRVSSSFVGFLIYHPAIFFQLSADVNALNAQGPLADGSLPLLDWLNAVAAMTAGLEEQKIFLAAADEVAHRTTGAPRLDPPSLPEYQEKIIHQDDMVTPAFLLRGLEASKAVAKLRVPRFENGVKTVKQGNPVIYLGTGWLLGDDLLMTNHHVVNARNEGEPTASQADFLLQGAAVEVLFDFDDQNLQGTTAAVVQVEAWDQTLDYALLRIAPTGRRPLSIRPTPLTKDQGEYPAVNIVQHPSGLSKRFAIRNNLVSAINANDIRYFTDTQAGSSGSPVLDDEWKVVALHRGSTFAVGVEFQGRSTAWVNLGTPIHSILNDMQSRYTHITY